MFVRASWAIARPFLLELDGAGIAQTFGRRDTRRVFDAPDRLAALTQHCAIEPGATPLADRQGFGQPQVEMHRHRGRGAGQGFDVAFHSSVVISELDRSAVTERRCRGAIGRVERVEKGADRAKRGKPLDATDVHLIDRDQDQAAGSRRFVRAEVSGRRRRSRRRRLMWHVLGPHHATAQPVNPDIEAIGGESLDRLAGAVDDRHVHGDEIDARSKHRLLRCGSTDDSRRNDDRDAEQGVPRHGSHLSGLVLAAEDHDH